MTFVLASLSIAIQLERAETKELTTTIKTNFRCKKQEQEMQEKERKDRAERKKKEKEERRKVAQIAAADKKAEFERLERERDRACFVKERERIMQERKGPRERNKHF